MKKLKKVWKRVTEKLDPKPMGIPVGYRDPPTLQEQMARMLRASQLLAAQEGKESFEEANDFDCDDDMDPNSPWEENFHGQFEKEAAMEKERENYSKRRKRDFVEEKPVEKKPPSKQEPKAHSENSDAD